MPEPKCGGLDPGQPVPAVSAPYMAPDCLDISCPTACCLIKRSYNAQCRECNHRSRRAASAGAARPPQSRRPQRRLPRGELAVKNRWVQAVVVSRRCSLCGSMPPPGPWLSAWSRGGRGGSASEAPARRCRAACLELSDHAHRLLLPAKRRRGALRSQATPAPRPAWCEGGARSCRARRMALQLGQQ